MGLPTGAIHRPSLSFHALVISFEELSMIPKSGSPFSEKIMLKQKVRL
jgi:hypothetical protein